MTEGSAGAVTMSPQPGPNGDQPGVEPPEPRGPAVLLPRRRPGHLGPMHVSQLLLVEVAIVAVLATVTRGLATALGAAGGAVLLVLVTLARRDGRWWLERRLMTRRYRRRRQAGPDDRYAGDPRLAALRTLAPGLTIEDVETVNGTRVGVARDDTGWFAVAEAVPAKPIGDGMTGLPLETVAAALTEVDQPGAVLQIVTRTTPALGTDPVTSSPAGYSYQQLLASFGPAQVAADRSIWIAVRLDARSLAEAVGDDWPDLDAAPAVVAALVRRIARSLQRVGISYRLRDADGLLGMLATSCDLEPRAEERDPAQPREDWSEWHSGRLAHRSFWIRQWPGVERAADLLHALSAAPTVLTTVALLLAAEPGSDLLDLRGLVRISAPAPELDAASTSLLGLARQHGAELFRLDGEQGPAVYATAPTGGGPR